MTWSFRISNFSRCVRWSNPTQLPQEHDRPTLKILLNNLISYNTYEYDILVWTDRVPISLPTVCNRSIVRRLTFFFERFQKKIECECEQTYLSTWYSQCDDLNTILFTNHFFSKFSIELFLILCLCVLVLKKKIRFPEFFFVSSSIDDRFSPRTMSSHTYRFFSVSLKKKLVRYEEIKREFKQEWWKFE